MADRVQVSLSTTTWCTYMRLIGLCVMCSEHACSCQCHVHVSSCHLRSVSITCSCCTGHVHTCMFPFDSVCPSVLIGTLSPMRDVTLFDVVVHVLFSLHPVHRLHLHSSPLIPTNFPCSSIPSIPIHHRIVRNQNHRTSTWRNWSWINRMIHFKPFMHHVSNAQHTHNTHNNDDNSDDDYNNTAE